MSVAFALVRLADLTTLRLGGLLSHPVVANSSDEIVDAVRAADAQGQALLLIGGGSNLVAADEGWPGAAVLVRNRGLDVRIEGDEVFVRAAAGEPWDELVQMCVASGWSGLETMSGIPGLAGATPVQNVGAYGAEIADVLVDLDVYDRESDTRRRWTPTECAFGFRTSAFKHTDRYVVLDITVRLTVGADSVPIHYAELARRLGIEPGQRAPIERVRETVLQLRRSKGMVLDEADHDSWSVGSFFVNPLLAAVPPQAKDCPRWATEGATKLSAAWLIENAGFNRGYARGAVAVSSKHTLALTNRGGATTADLLALAREIQAGVEARFGIRLLPEARLAPNIPAFT